MPIDIEDVRKIARLAKLDLTGPEAERYQNELSNILQLVEQMEQCDTQGVKEMTHPFDATLRLRPDVVTADDQRDKLQAIAPQAENGLYVVPKVID